MCTERNTNRARNSHHGREHGGHLEKDPEAESDESHSRKRRGGAEPFASERSCSRPVEVSFGWTLRVGLMVSRCPWSADPGLPSALSSGIGGGDPSLYSGEPHRFPRGSSGLDPTSVSCAGGFWKDTDAALLEPATVSPDGENLHDRAPAERPVELARLERRWRQAVESDLRCRVPRVTMSPSALDSA